MQNRDTIKNKIKTFYIIIYYVLVYDSKTWNIYSFSENSSEHKTWFKKFMINDD